MRMTVRLYELPVRHLARMRAPFRSSMRCGCFGNDLCDADPANDDFLGIVPDMGVAETKEAIDKAALAFKSWSKTTDKVIMRPCCLLLSPDPFRVAQARHDVLRKLYDLFIHNADDLARIIVSLSALWLANTNSLWYYLPSRQSRMAKHWQKQRCCSVTVRNGSYDYQLSPIFRKAEHAYSASYYEVR
jgi:hypothetical protein